MGIAWHYSIGVFLRQFFQRVFQLCKHGPDGGSFFLEIEAYVNGDLIVTTPCRVELLADIAYPLCEDGLDVHVDILRFDGELHLALLDVFQDILQRFNYQEGFVRRYDALLPQHPGVGDASRYIFSVQSLVELNGSVWVGGF